MAIPTIIGMLVTVIYNLTDTFFIGMLNNKSMTASIGVVFSFISIIQAIGFWYGYGSGNVMSRKLGENDETEAGIISSLGILFAIVSGIVIALFARRYAFELANFIGGGASENLLFYTTEYLKVIAISIPFTLYSITIYNQFRLCGNVKDAMLGLLAGMLSNMILDPILIFGLDMGFIGAAYATLTGHIISSIVLNILSSKHGNIPVRLKNASFNKKRVYHILAGGSPNFSRQAITSLAMLMLNIVAARYGENLIAAITVSSRIIALPAMVMIGWGQGFQPICAMNYGAKQYDRVKQAYKLSILIGGVFLVLASVLLFFSAENLAHHFSSNKDVITMSAKMIKIQVTTLPLLTFIALSSMLMQNTAHYFSALLISTARQGTMFIPLLFILPSLFGEFGVYILQPVSDAFSLIPTSIIIYKFFTKDKGR